MRLTRKLVWALIMGVGLSLLGGCGATTSKAPTQSSGGTSVSNPSSGGSTSSAPSAPTQAEIDAAKKHGTYHVRIETAKGTIEFELRGDLEPLTVANFVKLAKAGFYDGLTFHRVENWVVQGGDPSGNGTGGPGYTINLEVSNQLKNVRGAVAMARTQDPNSAGSQFYILKTDAPWLDGQYAVFGTVTKGMDVVDKLAIGDVMTKVTVED